MSKDSVGVLFVCLGNICRSPTAHGVFRALVEREGYSDRIRIDSAGTGAWHVGEPPDRRSQQVARGRGIDMSDLRARKAVARDFRDFDYVLAMDRENYRDLERLCPEGAESRLQYFLDYAPQAGRRDVPDPYYGGPSGFDYVFDLVAEASDGLLTHIKRFHFKE